MGGMGMGMGIGMGMGMDPGSGGYYNDLSLNSLDSYGSPSMPQQSLRSQPYPDYRKRSGMVGSSSSGNCYLTQTSSGGGGPLASLDAQVENFVGFNLHASAPSNLNYSVESAKSTQTIRDFLSTWKVDDEDEASAVLELDPPIVAVVAPVPSTPNYMYESLPPTGPQATAVVDHQGINLPDIIIDIEKASGNGGAPVDDSFGSFDVEKELDELRLKTSAIEQQPVNESEALAEILRQPVTAPLMTEQPSASLPLPSPILNSNEVFVSKPPVAMDFDQNNSSNSNESTFAKEYETFIHKIEGSESEMEDAVQDEGEYRENPKRFKFYKRKRRVTEPQESMDQKDIEQQVVNINQGPNVISLSPKASARASKKLLAKKRRNRIKMLKILIFESPKIKYRHYFRVLKVLRKRSAYSRTRQLRAILMKKQMTRLKENQLPLIKRLVKKFVAPPKLRNPPSLKGLSVSALNSSAFRSSLLSGTDRETVIKSGYSFKDKTEEVLEEQGLDTKSLELQSNFKGFDDIENTNMSPKIELRVEPEGEEDVKDSIPKPEVDLVPNKEEQIQAWLKNSVVPTPEAATEPSEPSKQMASLAVSSPSSSYANSISLLQPTRCKRSWTRPPWPLPWAPPVPDPYPG